MTGHLEAKEGPETRSADALLRAALVAERCELSRDFDGWEDAWPAKCDPERLWWVYWALAALGFRFDAHRCGWCRQVPS